MNFREKGVLFGTISLISKYPASSLRSGIGQVITKSESCSTTNLGGLKNVKLMLDICIKWPLIHPKAFEYFAVPPPKGMDYIKHMPNTYYVPYFFSINNFFIVL